MSNRQSAGPANGETKSAKVGQGALARWFRLERQLWWLALVGWRKPAPASNHASVFTHHRQAHWTLIAGVLSALVLIEGTMVHLWLDGARYVAAKWIALAAHLYVLVWVMGDAQALRLTVTRIGPNAEGERVVQIGVGLRGSACIPALRIKGCTTGTWDEPAQGGELVTVSGFANLSLTFDSPIEFVPMFGKPVLVTSLRVQMDDPEGFIRSLGPRKR